MNNILVKQEQKSDKEKRGKEKPKKKQVKITQQLIKNRLLIHFQHHIGESDKTTSEEIFQAVIGVNSAMVDSYARFYWFDIIQSVMRKLRRHDQCFIIRKKGNYFVLKDQEESDYYKGLNDRAIGHMENAKVRADEWVEKEKWRDMNIPEDENYEEPKGKKSILPPEDSYKDKLKTKVIKLWKGGSNDKK